MREKIRPYWPYILIVLVIYTNFLALQASSHVARRLLYTKPMYLCCNLLLLFAVYCIIDMFSPRTHISTVVFSTICTIWALVNDYVYALHGQIFTLAEFMNAGTAMNVIGKSLLFKRIPLIFGSVILFFYLFNIFLSRIQKKWETKRKYTYKLLLAGGGVCVLAGLSFPAKNMQEVILRDWTARNTCIEEGYPMYVYANIFMGSVKIIQPEGYGEETIQDYADYAEVEDKKRKPDIVLILNEAFYDLALLREMQTDIPYLGNYYSLDNAVRGYATTSVIGGGTNRSEFELLTSNTNYLLGELTPFNVLDMSCISSIVTNLKECGYYTMAAHPEDGGNYNRINSYAAMGFDEIHFKEDFENREYYANRERMSDSGAYKDLIAWYEAARSENENVFAYLLTMQNHSDYDYNKEEDALVHVQGDVTKIENELNEYLSCLYLSDLAFKELTEYFSKQEQPVILCMVGDHAPNIVREVADVDSAPLRGILARAMPFIIWANYDIADKDMGIISVNGLTPLLLEEAGVDMIPYYQYIRDMQEDIPVVGSFGSSMDAEGNIHSYYDDTEYMDKIWKYIYLSYNNLQKESIQGWFHLMDAYE